MVVLILLGLGTVGLMVGACVLAVGLEGQA
jgi:hypothetical protein